jgi:hypothetical protein
VKHGALIIDGRVTVLQAALDWVSFAGAAKFALIPTEFLEIMRVLWPIGKEMGAVVRV